MMRARHAARNCAFSFNFVRRGEVAVLRLSLRASSSLSRIPPLAPSRRRSCANASLPTVARAFTTVFDANASTTTTTTTAAASDRTRIASQRDHLQLLDIDNRLRAILQQYSALRGANSMHHDSDDSLHRQAAQDELQLVWLQCMTAQRDHSVVIPITYYWAILEAMRAVGTPHVSHFSFFLNTGLDRLADWQVRAVCDGLRATLCRQSATAAAWLRDDASIDAGSASSLVVAALDSESRSLSATRKSGTELLDHLDADFAFDAINLRTRTTDAAGAGDFTHAHALSASQLALGLYEIAFAHARLRQWHRVLPLFRLALAAKPDSFPRCQRLLKEVAGAHEFALLDVLLDSLNARLTRMRALSDAQRADVRRTSLSSVALAVLSHSNALAGASWVLARLEVVGPLSAHMLSEFALGHVLLHLCLRASPTELPAPVWHHLNDAHRMHCNRQSVALFPVPPAAPPPPSPLPHLHASPHFAASSVSSPDAARAAQLLARFLRLLPALPPGISEQAPLGDEYVVAVDAPPQASNDSVSLPPLFFHQSYFESRLHNLRSATHVADAVRLCELYLRTRGVATVDLVKRTLVAVVRSGDRVASEAILFLLLRYTTPQQRSLSAVATAAIPDPPSQWSFRLAALGDHDSFPVADFHLYFQLIVFREAALLKYDRDVERLERLLEFFVDSSALPDSWRTPSRVASPGPCSPTSLAYELVASKHSMPDALFERKRAPLRRCHDAPVALLATCVAAPDTADEALGALVAAMQRTFPEFARITARGPDFFAALARVLTSAIAPSGLPFIFTLSPQHFIFECLSAFRHATTLSSLAAASPNTLWSPASFVPPLAPISASFELWSLQYHTTGAAMRFLRRFSDRIAPRVFHQTASVVAFLDWIASLHVRILQARLQAPRSVLTDEDQLWAVVSELLRHTSASKWASTCSELRAPVVVALVNMLAPHVPSNCVGDSTAAQVAASNSSDTDAVALDQRLLLSLAPATRALLDLVLVQLAHGAVANRVEWQSQSLAAVFRLLHAAVVTLPNGANAALGAALSSSASRLIACALTHTDELVDAQQRASQSALLMRAFVRLWCEALSASQRDTMRQMLRVTQISSSSLSSPSLPLPSLWERVCALVNAHRGSEPGSANAFAACESPAASQLPIVTALAPESVAAPNSFQAWLSHKL